MKKTKYTIIGTVLLTVYANSFKQINTELSIYKSYMKNEEFNEKNDNNIIDGFNSYIVDVAELSNANPNRL